MPQNGTISNRQLVKYGQNMTKIDSFALPLDSVWSANSKRMHLRMVDFSSVNLSFTIHGIY